MPKATPRRVKGVDVPNPEVPLSLRGMLNLWHKRVNVVSGDMVTCRTGIKRSMLQRWIIELRLLANEMEKRLG